MSFRQKDCYNIDDLLSIMEILRSPQGCPWDREQTHRSIRRNMLEEAYEAAEAIDLEDADLLREELGDVLMQVVFHAVMGKEQGAFDFDGVCDGVCKKLILRHPHIFGDVVATTSEEVLRNWEDIKKQEKRQTTYTDTLNSVPKTLPALMYSEKVQNRAAKPGFDYPDVNVTFNDLRSEVDELDEAIRSADRDAMEDELGDVLFSVVNVARFLKIDPEQALIRSTRKFTDRFAAVERLAAEKGIAFDQAGFAELDNLWKEVKIMENKTLEVFRYDKG